MARIGPASREDVPADQREAFDRFVAERGSVPATGPLSVMLNAPGSSRLGAGAGSGEG
jgi:hypothetical protein